MRARSVVAATMALGSILGPTVASATGSIITGTVISVSVRKSDGRVFVAINGTASPAQPSCANGATGTSNYAIVGPTSDAGERQYAQLLAAVTSGNPVAIVGTGVCVAASNAEDISDAVSAH